MVAVDGSDTADKAFEAAIELMKDGDKLEVMTVAQVMEFLVPVSPEYAERDTQALEHLKSRVSNEAQSLLDKYKNKCEQYGVCIFVVSK